jgi:hypothetical protein
LLIGENLLGQLDVALGAPRADVIEEDGLAVAGSLGEADASRDYGAEDLFGKKLPQVVGDLAGEVGAVIVHGEQDAFDGQRGVEGIADMIDGIHEFGDAFEGEELALDGDQDGVGGD